VAALVHVTPALSRHLLLSVFLTLSSLGCGVGCVAYYGVTTGVSRKDYSYWTMVAMSSTVVVPLGMDLRRRQVYKYEEV